MMNLIKKYYWTAFLLPVFYISALALKPELGVHPTLEKVMCEFRLQSPYDREIATNVDIGTEWTPIKLSTPLRSTSHIQKITIVGNPETHEVVLDTGILMPSGLIEGDSFQTVTGKQLVNFYVKIYDENKQEIQLTQNSVGAIHSSNPPSPFLGFGLFGESVKKYYFEPDFKGTALFVKATVPTKVKAIEWTTPHYTKAPCHSWDDVNPDDIYRFGASTKK